MRNTRVAYKAPHTAGKQAEPATRWRLLTSFEQALQADADTEKRHTRADSLQENVAQPQPVDCLHHLAEMSHAGQNNLLRAAHLTGIAGYGKVRAKFRQRVLHRPDIARAVIDDGGHNKPLVEGSWSFNPSSVEQA